MTAAVVRLLADPRAAQWFSRRLGGRPGQAAGDRVCDLLPAGFAAYLRVLHPAGDTGLTWAEVAGRRGRRLGPLTDWSELATPGVPEPAVGTLPVEQLAALCDVLAGHTGPTTDCTFALRPDWAATTAGWSAVAAGPVPLVRLAGRDHILVRGAISEAVAVSFSDRTGHWWAQSPAFIWPEDRSWCVATDPGRRDTVVAGTVALAEDLLAAPDLEVWPVGEESVLPV